MDYQILPSLLSANITCLGDEIINLQQAGIKAIHLDVMDNHYVPNLTFGPLVCESLHQQFNTLAIDVHLMASPVDALISQFAAAGATRISIHPEATLHLDRSLQLIKEQACQAGLALNPATPIDWLDWCSEHLDFVLVMSVNPGFAGQTLIPSVFNKIKLIHKRYPLLPICVDGGITLNNIKSVADAGATQFVMGSSIFNTPDYATTIANMRQTLES